MNTIIEFFFFFNFKTIQRLDSSVDLMQLNRHLLEDGDRIQSPKHVLNKKKTEH
jgi:hypothetical protein